jgi:glycosyltransferase involved in cell wall biosynthesis
MSGRPKLLFLCHTLPYPPDGGVWLRSYNILRMLAQHYDVTALYFERSGTRAHERQSERAENLAALGRLGPTEVFPIPQAQRRWRFLWDHLRSVLRGRVFTYYLYESRAFRARLRALLRTQRFDLVHVDSLDLVGYLPDLDGLPVVCVHHNVESQLLRRRALAERSRLRRAYIAYQATLTEAAESAWCGRVALNVAVSEADARMLAELAPQGRFAVVPNGVDVEYFKPPDQPRALSGLVFVGGSDWFPNRDALEHFCGDILPHLGANGGRPPVQWVGMARPGDISFFGDRYGVKLTGRVPDVRPYVHAAECFVVPLRVGGGSRLKILDAWAMGKAVVSTSVGCEGLHAVHGENILVADAPKAFAAAVGRVLHDRVLRERLGAAARATVEREYSWPVIGRPMIELYDGLLPSAGG